MPDPSKPFWTRAFWADVFGDASLTERTHFETYMIGVPTALAGLAFLLCLITLWVAFGFAAMLAGFFGLVGFLAFAGVMVNWITFEIKSYIRERTEKR
jgi:hypothetical protein